MQEISEVKTSWPSRDTDPAFVEKMADACVQADVNLERMNSWRACMRPDHQVVESPKLPN